MYRKSESSRFSYPNWVQVNMEDTVGDVGGRGVKILEVMKEVFGAAPGKGFIECLRPEGFEELDCLTGRRYREGARIPHGCGRM